MDTKLLRLSSSPHIRSGDSIPKVMWTVFLALLPALIWSYVIFGLMAVKLTVVCVLFAMVCEAVCLKIRQQPLKSCWDGSAALTGLLVAFNVPPTIPLWMPMLGTAIAVIIVKQCFGGLGCNIFNPALIGRAFLLASFPKHMTSWTLGAQFGNPVDAISQATPLGLLKEGGQDALISAFGSKGSMYLDLAFGYGRGAIGCVGEISAVLLLLGGLFLLVRGIITWHIPVSFLVTLAVVTLIFKGDPLFAILSGGAMLGAWFMATDMVTSPLTHKGQLIFGAGCGLLTFIIRRWGGYPEGVSYSILIMNATVPLIDGLISNRVFGTGKK